MGDAMIKPKGPKIERETIINFNEEEANATLWTASATVDRRMRKRGFEPNEESDRSVSFVVPKSSVKLPRISKRKGNRKATFGRVKK
jgi:hypothetical protein